MKRVRHVYNTYSTTLVNVKQYFLLTYYYRSNINDPLVHYYFSESLVNVFGSELTSFEVSSQPITFHCC